eukprot:s3451_g10.t1
MGNRELDLFGRSTLDALAIEAAELNQQISAYLQLGLRGWWYRDVVGLTPRLNRLTARSWNILDSWMPAYVPPHRRGAAAVAEAVEKDLLNGKADGGPVKNLLDTVKNGHDGKRERWANIDDEAEDDIVKASPGPPAAVKKQAYRPPGARSRGDGDNVNFIRDIMNDFDTNAQGETCWGNAAPALTGKEVGGNETDLTEAQVRGDGEVPKPFTTMDINNDGVLQCEEFVQMIRFLMLDFYPHHILKHLNLPTCYVSE